MNTLVRTLLLILLTTTIPAYAAQSPVIWTGGITLDEREAAPADGTKLEFFVTSGSFLSDIMVSVKDNTGREIVNTVSQGPWLFLDLAPGTYSVLATRGNGDTQGAEIVVSGNDEKFSFMFPDN